MALILEICQGTACFVMGSSELLAIAEYMPETWREKVEIRGAACFDKCHDNRYGKAPYVRLDGEVMESASVGTVLLRIAEKLGDRDFRLPEDLGATS